MDMRKFKNVHFSTQLALTTNEARRGLQERKASLPSDMPARDRKEATELQSLGHLYDELTKATGASAALLRKNASVVEGHSPVSKLLGTLRLSDRFDPTGIDTEIGQRLKWGVQPLHTTVREAAPMSASFRDERVESVGLFEALAGPDRRDVIDLLDGTLFHPKSPCFCQFVNRTWTDRITRAWSYSLTFSYPCGIKWCSKSIFGVTVWYPCGVDFCTASITFNFSLSADVTFSATFDCLGFRISAQGSACASATVAGQTLQACIEVFATAGAGIDVEITSGSQAGQCMYGAELTLGLRVKVAGSVLWQGTMGYDFAIEMPCINLLGDDCLRDTLVYQLDRVAALRA
jgi:hypothetical protein